MVYPAEMYCQDKKSLEEGRSEAVFNGVIRLVPRVTGIYCKCLFSHLYHPSADRVYEKDLSI